MGTVEKLHRFVARHFVKLVALACVLTTLTCAAVLAGDRWRNLPAPHSATAFALWLAVGRMPNDLLPEGLFVVRVLDWLLSVLGWLFPLLGVIAALRAPKATRAFFQGVFQFPRTRRW
jgi:hypothetical protein